MTALLASLLLSTGCARLSPPPSGNFGSLALPAEPGETQLSAGAAFGGFFLGGSAVVGQFRAAHQLNEDWRLAADVIGGRVAISDEDDEEDDDTWLDLDGPHVGEGGVLSAGRLTFQRALMRDRNSMVGLMFGLGGGHYGVGDIYYATGDVSLPVSTFSDVGALYFGPAAALSVPIEQQGLQLSEDEHYLYPTTGYVGLNGGAALNLGDHFRYVVEMHLSFAGAPFEEEARPAEFGAAMSGGLVAQF
ncbi:hypothetical protein FIV42_16330 [Persicimonas caeni]|uniref:Uncharacterized protein n=1 Tax=Persicimonas caeni TaxID=2292766 RepID=A0A4Y6PVB2_PERCE|nr:hypothetical protein [Persicimonas caeni]QDG52248.1 hypothetical protein FIV42_16330 [Persicimonas caeni]QED33470.1 hypothetical protein FRD00_16325 [Persicimonas caeni]